MKGVKYIFFPLALIWGFIQKIREILYLKGILQRAKAPFQFKTIVVGNLAFGGTGKTPLVLWLSEIIQREGKQVAVLSRGYGRKSKGFFEVTEFNSEKYGDEPLEIKYHNESIRVFICEDRVKGLEEMRKMLIGEYMVILDDAFQHLKLKADTYFLLSKDQNPFYRDFPFPMGWLREFRSASRRADAIIWTKIKMPFELAKHLKKTQPLLKKNIPQWGLNYVQDIPKNEKGDLLERGFSIMTVNGLALGNEFNQELGKNYEILESLNYHDHARFTQIDFEKWEEIMKKREVKYLVMSRKDAMRIPKKIREKNDHWYWVHHEVMADQVTELAIKEFIL